MPAYMKMALAAGMTCLLLSIAACQPTRGIDRIHVGSLRPAIDTHDPAHATCQSFAMDADAIAAFFRTAVEVGAQAFHDRSIILPCRYEGTLTMEGRTWRFAIDAGGAGYLYRAGGASRRYLCEQRCRRVLARNFGED